MVAMATAGKRDWQQGEIDPLDPEPPKAPVSSDKVSPLSNQLYQGDCIEVLEQWSDKTFHCCVTDPPYNIARDRKGLSWAFSSHVTIDSEWDRYSPEDYEEVTTQWLKEGGRTVKEHGNIFIFGS